MRNYFLLFLLFASVSCFSQESIDTTGSKISGTNALAILNHHNKVRAEVNLPPLKWSTSLAAFAQNWADSLTANGACEFQHRQNNQYGENLFTTSAKSGFKLVAASEAWYAEKVRYIYSRIGEAGSKGAGHYTQMVWKKTTELGVGIATCANGNTIVVANYNPSGNYVGEYPY